MTKEQLTDEQLDAMLRRVEVPNELKNTLLSLPESLCIEPVSDFDGKHVSNGRYVVWGISIAVACLLGTIIWVSFAMKPRGQEDVALKPNLQVQTKTKPAVTTELTVAAKKQLELLKSKRSIIESQLLEYEVAALETQLATVHQNNETPGLSIDEFQSMVGVVAGERLRDEGASQESVNLAMTQVIRKFPGTRGAMLAAEELRRDND